MNCHTIINKYHELLKYIFTRNLMGVVRRAARCYRLRSHKKTTRFAESLVTLHVLPFEDRSDMFDCPGTLPATAARRPDCPRLASLRPNAIRQLRLKRLRRSARKYCLLLAKQARRAQRRTVAAARTSHS